MAVFGEMTQDVWNESEKAYITYLSGMEDALKTSPFVAGKELTLADICLVPQVFNANRFDCDLTRFPTILRINETCMALDAFQKAQPENQPDAE